MANRITHEFNNILDSSNLVADFYTKGYMPRWNISSGTFARNETTVIEDINMYYRVKGFEVYQDNDRNSNHIHSVAKSVLGITKNYNSSVTFTIASNGSEQKMYFGTNHICAEQVKNVFSGNVYSVSVANEWIKPAELQSLQQYNGYVLGISQLEAGAIDNIINTLGRQNYLLSFILTPISTQEIEDEIFKINQYIEAYQRVSRTEMMIGSNRARRFDNDNQDVMYVLDVLKKEKERLEEGRINGLWYVTIGVSSSSYDVYKAVGSTVVSSFMEYAKKENQTTHAFLYDANESIVDKTLWKIPTAFLGSKDLGGIYGMSLVNIANIEVSSSLLLLPLHSHHGYSVKHLGDSASSDGVFELYQQNNPTPSSFLFGNIDNGDSFYIDIDNMRQHVFVTGTTRYGKSTSVRKMLCEARKKDVSFVVIEAAKKEYWELVKCEEMAGIKVFSSGNDATPLKINPFQPEDNTVLDYHIQNVIQAFLSIFDETDPVPQILTELVYLCYEKKGWDVSRRVTKDCDLVYPTLSDMLTYLDECIDSIGYGEEIKNNMRGVLKIRLSALIRQAGSSLNTSENTSIAQMFDCSSVVELDDFTDRNKPFVASILAIKASEYSRQQKIENRLRRLLVIEEAHHILPNPELRSATKNAAECSKYFSNMLAEVSAYGTGVVIVDQRPSQIASSAIANTGMKIIHNMREGEDIEVIARSLALRDYESALLNKLEVGQAIITLPQKYGVSRVRVKGILNISNMRGPVQVYDSTIEGCKKSLINDFEKNVIESQGFNVSSINTCIKSIENKNMIYVDRTKALEIISELARMSNLNDVNKRQIIFEYLERS